ncbi:aromatic-ring-hydroxylating dioxygenase subunit beta [Klebsiella aerogenes]|uniref:aromatic-ring-hydroxylating dioxygenase subunit beta n=1 Tax=Klebsiella aerogenes TaxID=548 RepID=UPI00063C8DAE|nr:aromatic-ring-hydroxylating dioxygenase subunit beta [Klebsiella aerogenes]KLF56089.1 aromatic-ring-hydroxylating dioxygenase [Klebsiella aerogenes]MDX7184312.1 aromatic-ring-hydroxylating dioxygenase subunit beta [Klebsiella aerogenes]HCT8366108.1 hypothetical protein [Klebsiella aerogenes]
MNTSPILNAAIQFINLEADLLDQGEFREWLALWRAEGMYIIPIDQKTTDFANVLNYAYDNHEMREKRVQRLYSGESISTTPRARTIRMSGRYRLLSANDEVVEVRCAQLLYEYRKGNEQHYAADVTWTLAPEGDSFRILQKVVHLINGDDYLHSIGYIL